MAKQIEPADLPKLLGTMREGAEAARKQFLARLEQDAAEEVAAYRRRRDELARVAPNDPRLAVLDARVEGAKKLGDFAHRGRVGEGTPPKGGWVVTGRVLDPSGKPVAGARLTLATDDAKLERLFGEVKTGSDGRFEARHSGEEMKDVFARAPKARVVVTTADGKLTATTHEIEPAADRIEMLDISLAPAVTTTVAKKPARAPEKAAEPPKKAAKTRKKAVKPSSGEPAPP